MDSPFSSSCSFSLPFLIFFVFILLPVCLGQDDLYTNCGKQFVCGDITAGYPFWGNDRSKGCGVTELHLTCESDVAKIEINNIVYHVLSINPNTQVLRLAREDLLGGYCLSGFVNSTLDHKVFDYVPGYTNVTFLYGCPDEAINGSVSSFYTCSIIEAGSRRTTGINSKGYVQEGAHGPGSCDRSVYVPVPLTAVPAIANLSASEEVLNAGFEARYLVDAKACTDCNSSYGVCGYDLTSNQTTCYCSGQPSGSTACPPSPSGAPEDLGTNRSSLGIGLGVGAAAVIASVALVFWFLVKKWRKKEALTILNEDWAMHRVDDRKIQDFFQNNHSLIPKKYSHSDIKKMTNSFSDKLGQGGFGSVYTGKLRDGRPVAIKVLNNSKGNGEEFINEVASICRTSHVNIVTLLGYCHEGTKRALIYEYMDNGSLDKFINRQESSSVGRPLEWKVLFDIAVGIARGLEYLHRGCNTRIVHFDIKPHNILLDENFCPKISDFGLAKLCKTKESKMTTLLFARGTAGYIAPEVFCRTFGGVSYKSDVYSYGMMVLDMVGARKNSHVAESQSSESFFPDWVFKQLEPDEFSRVHGDVTEEEETKVRKMIIVGLWCIQTNPLDRPTMTKAVEMLEGNLQSLQIPPKPVLSSPVPLPQVEFSSTVSSSASICVVSEE